MSYTPEDPPVVIEHTTVNPVQRETVIERGSPFGEPWAIVLMLAVVAVLGIVAFFTFSDYNQPSQVVTSSTTRIEHDDGGRAQAIAPPNVVVNPPASSPTINVTPPASNSTVNVNPAPSNPAPSGDQSSNPSNSGPDNSGSGKPDSENDQNGNGNGPNSNPG